MNKLAREAWDLYDKCKSDPHVVAPAIPILFFGDSEAYAVVLGY